MKIPPPLVIISGPTASGKSRLALDLALEFSGTVINADSMQVYRQLEIITARPSAEDMAKVPHRLFGEQDASEPCSAGRWRKMAVAEINAAHAGKRLPVIVGGTGLYVKSLVEGLAEIPDIPDKVRAEAAAVHTRLGGEEFKSLLAAIDPTSAERIPAGDTQRLIRAYEVFLASGKTLSEWREDQKPSTLDARMANVVLMPPREELYRAIDDRFDEMMEKGALDEVAALAGLELDPSLPAMKALGVRELIACVDGKMDIEQAIEAAKRSTRNFAKRQLTWLRHQTIGSEQGGKMEIYVSSAKYSESMATEIFSFIRQFLLTG